VASFGLVRRVLPCLCWLVPAAALAAETPIHRSAADELEAELRAQIDIPDPELVIVTDGPDPERYGLVEALVEVDGAAVPGPVQPGWGMELYRSRIVPGNHVITAQFVYRGGKTGPYPWNESYRYRVPGKVELQAQRGLRLTVHLRVETRDEAEDSRSRLAFRAALEPEMIARVDDAPLPPPPTPKLAPPGPEAAPATVPAPKKPIAKTPKKKKATTAASLDVATARLKKAIAQPGAIPERPSTQRRARADAGDGR
jgi:hypothetical protein